MWDIKRHPTVLAFALEGDTSPHWSNRSLWTDTLVDNPQGLPVFGKQYPSDCFKWNTTQTIPTSINVALRTALRVGSSRPLRNPNFWIGHRSPNPMQMHTPTMQHWEVSFPLHGRLEERTAQTIQKNSKPGARLGKRPLIRLNRPLCRVICVRLQTSRSTPAPMDG